MTVYFDPSIARPEGCRCMVPLPQDDLACICLFKPDKVPTVERRPSCYCIVPCVCIASNMPAPATTAPSAQIRELTVSEFAAKILAGMDRHELSWVDQPHHGGYYSISTRDAMVQEFGDHPLGQLAYLLAFLAWNDTYDWASNPHPVTPVTFPDKTASGQDEETP